MIQEELIKAYKQTTYKVFELGLDIKVGQYNEQLDELLKSYRVGTWAFITAYNPFSQSLSKEANESRHDQLKQQAGSYKWHEGAGVGEDASWEPEKSLFILGMDKLTAIALGKQFEQNAIVFGEQGALPELILLKQ